MEIKFVSSPIGVFESTYSNSGLLRLSFLWGRESRHSHDRPLQKKIDKFFSPQGLKTLPLIDMQGTSFQLNVWSALCDIPRGQTESYISIATSIGAPKAARAVGTACKMNPIPLFIPCHRVIKQDQSYGAFALGAENKKFLLNIEAQINEPL